MMRVALKQSYLQIIISLLLLLLFGISLITFWYQTKINTEIIITDDVATLATIFKKINKACTIIDFKYQQQNYIDFLNVISFKGSEIGTMNLKYPKKWRGPYLRDNPTVQGKHYQIVRTNQGYFIAPGNGVKLKNGAVIGKDIILDMNADIFAMMKNPAQLNFQGKPLAVHLDLSQENSIVPIEPLGFETVNK